MKKVYISLMTGSSWGGSEDCWLKNLEQNLEQEPKTDFLVICTTPNNIIRKKLITLGVRYETAPWSNQENHSIFKKIFYKFISHRSRSESVSRKIKNLLKGADRILINQGGSICLSNYPNLVKELISGEHIFDIICHSPIMSLPTDDQISLMNQALNYCRKVHLLSANAASELEAFFNADKDKFQIFKNPVTYPISHSIPSFTKRKRLGFVGRLSAAKGVDFVLRLLLEHESKEAIDSIHFFGSGELPNDLLEKIRNNSIAVNIHGSISSKEKIYSEFDFLVLPSRVEALPNVLIEAAMYARFPLVPQIGSVPIVMPPDWEYYINPLDYSEFKNKVLSALTLPSEYLQNRVKEFQRSVQRYQEQSHLLSF